MQELGDNATDEALADAINSYAREAGKEYQTGPEDVAKWRAAASSVSRPVRARRGRPAEEERGPTPAAGEEGQAMGVLRDLVRLLGKDGTKRLIDSL